VLLLLIAAIWLIVMVMFGFSKVRDFQFERSIDSFRDGFERLSSRGKAFVQPAGRSDDDDFLDSDNEDGHYEPLRQPRLRVVPPNATAADMAAELSWSEWSEELAFDDARFTTSPRQPVSRAAAYHAPMPTQVRRVAPTRPTMSGPRQLRRTISRSSLVSTAVLTVASIATGWFLLNLLAIVSWVATIAYFSMMYVAFTQDEAKALSPSFVDHERENEVEMAAPISIGQPSPVFVPESGDTWTREAAPRYASGQ